VKNCVKKREREREREREKETEREKERIDAINVFFAPKFRQKMRPTILSDYFHSR